MNRAWFRPGIAVLLGAVLASGGVRAGKFENIEFLSRSGFKVLAKNFGASTQYRAAAPVEGLGIIGFDAGLGVSYTHLDERNRDPIDKEDFLLMLRLNARKSLPFGFDIGTFVGAIPDTDITVIGAELGYALLDGSVDMPSLALRTSFSRFVKVSDLDLANAGLELVVSKDMINLTPYAGAGFLHTRAEASEADDLDDVIVNQGKAYVGLNVNLGLDTAFEYELTGDYWTLSAKVGAQF